MALLGLTKHLALTAEQAEEVWNSVDEEGKGYLKTRHIETLFELAAQKLYENLVEQGKDKIAAKKVELALDEKKWSRWMERARQQVCEDLTSKPVTSWFLRAAKVGEHGKLEKAKFVSIITTGGKFKRTNDVGWEAVGEGFKLTKEEIAAKKAQKATVDMEVAEMDYDPAAFRQNRSRTLQMAPDANVKKQLAQPDPYSPKETAKDKIVDKVSGTVRRISAAARPSTDMKKLVEVETEDLPTDAPNSVEAPLNETEEEEPEEAKEATTEKEQLVV